MWDTTQVLGNELGLSITALGPPQVTANATDGPSPIYITVNETDALRFNYTSSSDSSAISVRLFSTDLSQTDAVPEEQVHEAWAANGYPVYNSTPAPGPVQQAFDDYGQGIILNPFNDPDCIKYVFLFQSCMAVGGVGVALEQKVTVFTHIFYGYTPQPGWRFAIDGDPPAPPS